MKTILEEVVQVTEARGRLHRIVVVVAIRTIDSLSLVVVNTSFQSSDAVNVLHHCISKPVIVTATLNNCIQVLTNSNVVQ